MDNKRYVVRLAEGAYLNASAPEHGSIKVPRTNAFEYTTKSWARKAARKFIGARMEEVPSPQ